MKKNNILVVIIVILSVLLASSIAFTVYLSLNEKVETENVITAEEKDAALKNIIEKFKFYDYYYELGNANKSMSLYYFSLPENEKEASTDYYTKNITLYVDWEKQVTKYDKCPDSVKNEMIKNEYLTINTEGEYMGHCGYCEEFTFVKREVFENAKDEYFGKNSTLEQVQGFYSLKENKLYLGGEGGLLEGYEAKLYDSKMPKKDTVELYYDVTRGWEEKINQKVKYTFKKEDSNWILYNAKEI